jgi:hypothetical protein
MKPNKEVTILPSRAVDIHKWRLELSRKAYSRHRSKVIGPRIIASSGGADGRDWNLGWKGVLRESAVERAATKL